MRRLLLRALLVAMSALSLTWLLLSDGSPASDWLLVHPLPSNVAMAANVPAYLAAATVSGNVHAPGSGWLVTAIVTQWLLVGLLTAWLSSKLWPNNSFKPKPLRGSA